MRVPSGTRLRAGTAGPTVALVRVALTAGMAAVGAWVAAALLARGALVGPNNLLYLSLLGGLVGWLLSGRVARAAERKVGAWADRLARIPPETVLAAGTGATVALVITVLLNNVLANVPGFTWYWSLLIAGLLVASSAAFFAASVRW